MDKQMNGKFQKIVAAILIILQLIILSQLQELRQDVERVEGNIGSIWDRMEDQDIKWYQWVEEYRQNEGIVTED